MKRTFGETAKGERPDGDSRISRIRSGSDRGELTWDQLLTFPRVLLVAEAGAGKTHECQQQADLLFEQGQAAFFLRLENVAVQGVRASLRSKQRRRLKAWRASSSQIAYFFLDSIDELQLAHIEFRSALYQLADDLEGALGRAVIVVTSRPVPIDRSAFKEILPVPEAATDRRDSTEFVRVAMRDTNASDGEPQTVEIKEVELLPLSDQQIAEIARGRRVDSPEELLTAIRARHAYDFVRWPQGLIELCDDWRVHGEIRPHYKQVKSHVKACLTSRVERREKAELSIELAREGVQRLALAVMLCRSWTFRHNATADIADSGEEPINTASLLEGWTASQIAALLERPIFGDGGYGRVKFRHRSVVEFLAACQIDRQISSGSLSLSAGLRMLAGMTDSNHKVLKPSLRPVAAWLSLLRRDVFEVVMRIDPGTLLIHGDPESLSELQCQQALHAFAERHGKGNWRGLQVPSLQLSRLARHSLGSTILNAWKSKIENPEIRELLLQLVAEGEYRECANLAASVAADPRADNAERFDALIALSKLSDDRLGDLVESAVHGGAGWPLPLGRWVGTHLYPEHVTDEQLLALLAKIGRKNRQESDYADRIARVIQRAELSSARLKNLLPGLSTMTRAGTVVKDEEYVEPEDRLKVSAILQAVCVRLLERKVAADGLEEAAVLAFRTSGEDHGRRNAELAGLINGLHARHRKAIFDADYAWALRAMPARELRSMAGRIAFMGPQTYTVKRDRNWILEALADPAADSNYRAILLYVAIYVTPRRDGRLHGTNRLRRAVGDSTSLLTQLDDSVKASRPDPRLAKMQEDQRKRDEERQRKREKDRRLWLEFWRSLAEHPERALKPKRQANTIWNLSQVLRNRKLNEGEDRWDRAFLVRNFGVEITNALREGLRAYWRSLRPTVRSERQPGEKGTYLVVWTIGLMGVYAEAEDDNWAGRLSSDEADLAARYALIELNGLPRWLMSLAAEHPQVVERVIGAEINEELAEPGGPTGWHSTLLQALRYGSPEIAALLQRRLMSWLKSGRSLMHNAHDKAIERKVEHVVLVLLAHGSQHVRMWLTQVAMQECHGAPTEPHQLFWLPVLCHADARRGLATFFKALETLPVEKDGLAVRLVGSLFKERRIENRATWRASLEPHDLLRLVQAIYRHVRPDDDVLHDSVYTPNFRDHAEDGRRIVFNELMATRGSQALSAKKELADDPAFAHLRDHIAALALERLAAEVDEAVYDADDLAGMFGGRELTPKTGTDMAHLLVDRLDDLQELMLSDAGPRAVWSQATDEAALRSAIAHELQMISKDAYTVDQEAITADGKETDIRLRAVSHHQATIELKLGEQPRSAAELRAAIEGQLILKYMAHESARTGCLLVSVSDPHKYWWHPDTGVKIYRDGLQALLSEEAHRAQLSLGGDARVLARVLNLTPRLGTEASLAKKTRDKPRTPKT